jgi:hypothetical protein
MRVDDFTIQPSLSVRADRPMRTRVSLLVSRCFGALRQLWTVHRDVSAPVIQAKVTSPVLTAQPLTPQQHFLWSSGCAHPSIPVSS